MAVDLEWYRVFYHVARCGGITRAAQELYISQPAVSQCIRQLEQELNCSLLIRGSKGVTLTAEGRALFQFVEAGISELSRGEEYMRQITGLEEGRVSIGASDLTLEFFLLEHLQAFHKAYPGIHIHVTNGPTPEALRQLQAGQVDFAAVTDPIAERQPWMQVHPVRPIREIFVASRSGFGHLEGLRDRQHKVWLDIVAYDADSVSGNFIVDTMRVLLLGTTSARSIVCRAWSCRAWRKRFKSCHSVLAVSH